MAAAPESHEFSGQRTAWRGKQANPTEPLTEGEQPTTAMFDNLSGGSEQVRPLVRTGAVFAVFFESACLYERLGSPLLQRLLPFHLLNLGLSLTILAAALWPGEFRHWRKLILATCAAIMVNTSAICMITGRFEPLFISVVGFVVATGFLPWSVVFQGAMGVTAVACYLVPTLMRPGPDHAPVMHWFGLIIGVGLAQAGVSLRARNRRELTVTREELRRQLEALKESEQKFRSVFEANPDPILIAELHKGTIIDVNEAFVRRICYSREHVLGRSLTELNPYPDRDERRRLRDRLMQNGYLRDVEMGLQIGDERVQMLLSAVIVESGTNDRIVCIMHDITRIRAAESELRASEQKFRKIFDSSLDYIAVMSMNDGRIVDVNQEFTRGLGYTREEAVGKRVSELGLSELDFRRQVEAELRKHGFYRSADLALRASDGRTIDALCSFVVTRIGDVDSVVVFARDISHLKEAERKLRESEATLREIFDSSLDEISVVDMETMRLVDVNPEFLRGMGLSREMIIGHPASDISLLADPDQIKPLREKLLSEGVARNVEVTVRRPDGKMREMLTSTVLMQLNGRVCTVSFSRDISDLKAAVRALRDSEEKFRRIFESNLDIVLIVDSETDTIVEVNEEFVRRTGFSRRQALGATTTDLGIWTDPATRNLMREELRRAGYAQGLQASLRTQAGASIETLVSSAIIRLQGKDCVLSVARDISDLKAIESALRESEEKFRGIFEKAVDMVVLTSLTTGTIIEVNEEFVRNSGYSREESIGKSNADLNIWVDFDDRDRFFAELAEKGFVKGFESTMRIKDGATLPVVISSVAVRLGNQQCTVTVLRDVSQLRKAESELRESEARLRKIFEASTESIAVTDIESGVFVDVNQTLLESSGYSREQIVGRSALEIGFWERPEQRDEFYRLLAETGRVHNLEVDFRVNRRTTHPALVSAVIVPIRGRQCILSMARNISDRKETEQKLKDSERTLRRIFNSSLDPMVINTMANGQYVEVNDAFLEISGLRREEVIGRSFVELGVWPDREEWKQYDRQLRENGKVRNQEAILRVKCGDTFPALISGTLVEIRNQPCCLSIVRDISNLKEAERQLRESSEMLRQIFQSSADNISLIDMITGTVVDINEETERRLGYSKEELVGKRIADLNIIADPNLTREMFHSLDKHGQVRNLEMPLRTRSGRILPALVSANVIELNANRYALSIARDITQLKETQSELEAAREAALAASNAKSEFLSSMSHEIRTPMNSILGMTELLSETKLSGEQRRYLETVINNGNALLDLINSILDLAKVESGRLNLEEVTFDIVELTEKVAETLAVRAHEKGLELAVRFAPDLPAAVVGDPLRLRQVLTNLVGNAIKFTRNGEVVVNVERDPAGATPTTLRFSIADNGVGIARDKLTSIFSPFTQADSSTTRRYGGSGLGLAIVDRLVRLMGGHVWAESTPGMGSVFKFTARFAPADDGAITQHERPKPRLEGAKILVVDDSATARAIIHQELLRAGARVAQGTSAAEAIEALELARRTGEPYCTVFIDCRMPDMDGIELALKIRELGEVQPLVMMPESVALSAALAAMRECGLVRYVVKPVKRSELWAAAASAVAGEPPPEHKAKAQGLAHETMLIDRKLRILLADDSEDNRTLIRAYLKKTPYLLDEAEDGSVAVEKFKERRYDLVLMDIQMPVLDGYAAVRAIRQWEHETGRLPTPVIALTASVLGTAVQRAIDAGCNLHVSKPAKKATLLASISKAVGGNGGYRNGTHNGSNGIADGAGSRSVIAVDADIGDLIPGFLERKRQDARRLLKALDGTEVATAARIAHRLKGEGGSYGFEEITEIGAALEAAVKTGEINKATQLANRLVDYLATVQVVYPESAEPS